MARITPITYQGPERTFSPDIGDMTQTDDSGFYPTSSAPGEGYADLDYLLSLLDDMSDQIKKIYDQATFKLKDFALVINNATLRQAHDIAYPEDDTPDAISFEEYKYLQLNNTSNASQYVLSAYENALRNPPGTNALDICNLVFYIQNEISRIKGFIESYVGDLDDTAEFRTVELFQDWAEDTSVLIKKLWQAVKGEVSIRLPQSELDQLTQETAGQFQAFFQVKLNKINQNITDLLGRLNKTWEETSDFFYRKQLGPALKFQLNSARFLQSGISPETMPVLANELAGSMIGIDANYSVALADQVKRNKVFLQFVGQIFLNIVQRDSYFKYMEDLSSVGKTLPIRYTNSETINQSSTILNSISDGITASSSAIDYSDNLAPSHNTLSDLDSDDAHPQYLLKSGGEITGDITFADGVTIDGMVLKLHKHTGRDGSEKINGSDIDYNSITEDVIDTTDPTTSIPENLRLVSQDASFVPPGLVKVTAEINFDVTTSSNITGYEFEIIKL